MRQAEVRVAMVQSELLAQPLLAFAQRGDSPSDRRHMLTDGEVEAFNEGGGDLPAAGRSHLVDGLQGPEDHPVAHAHQAPPAYRLDHLRIEQLGEGHPARLRGGACGLAALGLDPLPEMGEERGGVLREAVSQEEGHTAGRQHLDDLVKPRHDILAISGNLSRLDFQRGTRI